MTFLAGFLLANKRKDKLDGAHFEHIDRIKGRCPGRHDHWEQASYVSQVALTEQDRQRGSPPFSYPLEWRLSGSRVLLLSHDGAEVVEDFRKSLAAKSQIKLSPVAIAVDSFVKDTAREPSGYVLSFVHARVSAFGTSLTSISFYGADVSEAKFFRDGLDLFNCHTCGIRRVTGGAEIVRLGNDGSVSFKDTGVQRLKDVETVLSHLRSNGYLADDPVEEGDL